MLNKSRVGHSFILSLVYETWNIYFIIRNKLGYSIQLLDLDGFPLMIF